MNKALFRSLFFLTLIPALLSGCSSKSYPGDKLKEAIATICKNEYGIDDVDVKVADTTIAVYLPLKKLFAADFKEAAITGKVRNLESLFELAPEALEKVEDVLLTISRVLLSTDRNLEFYSLQATDVSKTGMQLVLSGYLNDIKRVRIWDISRNEYRKRIVNELRMNRPARWHQSVRDFFHDLETKPATEVRLNHLSNAIPLEAMQTLFVSSVIMNPETDKPDWDILDIRSVPVQKNQVLVYVKAKPNDPRARLEADQVLQYLFMLVLQDDEIHIARIIPFQFRDEATGTLQQIPFPKELQIQENLDHWETEFNIEAMTLGSFLAEQMTRRVQALVSGDERIINTFREIKELRFEYIQEPAPAHFSLKIEAPLADFNHYSKDSVIFHEDMLYLLEVISREFVEVLRSYNFGNYENLTLKLSQEPSSWIIPRSSLELFRKNKESLQAIFSLSKI